MIVDLHIHTNASDGCDNPMRLIDKASKLGIGILAVTDHDSIDNVAETVSLGEKMGITVIKGVEICSTFETESFHILAYNFDLQHKQLTQLLGHNTDLLVQKDEHCIDVLQELGWAVSPQEFAEFVRPNDVGGWKALNYLQAKGLCSGVADFFARIFTKENGLRFPTFPTSKEVIDCIHAAGGVAVLAHPASTNSFRDNGSLEHVLRLFETLPIDGYECYHSEHSAAAIEELLAYCHTHSLISTAGSDYHGDFVPQRQLAQPRVLAKELNLQGLL